MKIKHNIKNLRILLPVFIFCLLSGCLKGSTKLSPIDKDAVVLAFGDSLTFGTGAKINESYPAVLEGLINRRVINAGVPGEVTQNGLERLPALLDEYHPALLILCHGGNDLLRRMDEKQAINNIKAMINLAKSRNIDVVLIGVPEFGLFLSSAGFYKDIAEEFNIPYDDEILPEIIRKPDLKSDQIHPNAQGYIKMAETLAKLLKKYGAI
ncbi:MAG: arylesterase [bacterium]|nr:arylesterase [bacterium]